MRFAMLAGLDRQGLPRRIILAVEDDYQGEYEIVLHDPRVARYLTSAVIVASLDYNQGGFATHFFGRMIGDGVFVEADNGNMGAG